MTNPKLKNIDLLHSLLNDDSVDPKLKARISKVFTAIAEETVDSAEKQLKAAQTAAEQRAIAAKHAEAAQRAAQDSCSHLKVNPITNQVESFLMGQHNQEGRLILMCQNSACQKVYSNPPMPELGWDTVPTHLMPKKGVGGVIDLRATTQMTQKALQASLEDKSNGRRNSK